MGFSLSSGFRAAISLSCFLDRFLCSIWNPVSSPRPAVLQSRRAQELSRLAVAPTFPRPLPLARPYLDSSEHGGTLDAVGMTIRGEPAFGRADQSRHILVFGGSKGSEPLCRYTHRQRGSEAAVPNLLIGMKAMRWCEQPLPQIVLGGSSLKSAGAPKLEFLSSCWVF